MKPCDLLKKDHRRIERLLERISRRASRYQAGCTTALRSDLDLLAALTEPHFRREEQVLYPALRPRYPQLVDRMDNQHERVRECGKFLRALLSDVPSEPASAWLEEFGASAEEYCTSVRNHISDEEDQLFRVAAACLTAKDQARLGALITGVS